MIHNSLIVSERQQHVTTEIWGEVYRTTIPVSVSWLQADDFGGGDQNNFEDVNCFFLTSRFHSFKLS